VVLALRRSQNVRDLDDRAESTTVCGEEGKRTPSRYIAGAALAPEMRSKLLNDDGSSDLENDWAVRVDVGLGEASDPGLELADPLRGDVLAVSGFGRRVRIAIASRKEVDEAVFVGIDDEGVREEVGREGLTEESPFNDPALSRKVGSGGRSEAAGVYIVGRDGGVGGKNGPSWRVEGITAGLAGVGDA
jgi:hypothetical protein